MKVAMVLRNFTRRGSARYATEVSSYMAKQGHDVHIFSNQGDAIAGLKLHKLPMLPGNFYLSEASLIAAATARVRRGRFDVVYSQPGRYFTPHVAGVHILTRPWMAYKREHNMPIGTGERVLAQIEAWNLHRCKRAVAISQRIKDELIEWYGVPESKIAIVHNGVNTEEFKPRGGEVRERVRRQYDIPADCKLLLFIGNPFSRKGLGHLIEAIPRLDRDVHLLVFGRDDAAPYIRRCRELGIHNRVKFVTGRLIDDIAGLYAAADVFVFPTLYEPFGLVITEAMASGLPVVTSARAGAAELIEDGRDGLLLKDPTNPNEIAERLSVLMGSDRLMRNMGREARKKAEQHSWDKAAANWLKVFEEAARA
jgi:UDP-glucose:(heptosyl)LPS alpha-1,3-glucosyltransferase